MTKTKIKNTPYVDDPDFFNQPHVMSWYDFSKWVLDNSFVELEWIEIESRLPMKVSRLVYANRRRRLIMVAIVIHLPLNVVHWAMIYGTVGESKLDRSSDIMLLCDQFGSLPDNKIAFTLSLGLKTANILNRMGRQYRFIQWDDSSREVLLPLSHKSTLSDDKRWRDFLETAPEYVKNFVYGSTPRDENKVFTSILPGPNERIVANVFYRPEGLLMLRQQPRQKLYPWAVILGDTGSAWEEQWWANSPIDHLKLRALRTWVIRHLTTGSCPCPASKEDADRLVDLICDEIYKLIGRVSTNRRNSPI